MKHTITKKIKVPYVVLTGNEATAIPALAMCGTLGIAAALIFGMYKAAMICADYGYNKQKEKNEKFNQFLRALYYVCCTIVLLPVKVLTICSFLIISVYDKIRGILTFTESMEAFLTGAKEQLTKEIFWIKTGERRL